MCFSASHSCCFCCCCFCWFPVHFTAAASVAGSPAVSAVQCSQDDQCKPFLQLAAAAKTRPRMKQRLKESRQGSPAAFAAAAALAASSCFSAAASIAASSRAFLAASLARAASAATTCKASNHIVDVPVQSLVGAARHYSPSFPTRVTHLPTL
jgi:hypothetical protein